MSAVTSNKWLDWAAAFRIGNHTFGATLFLVGLAVLGAMKLLPILGYVFGVGWVAPAVTVLFMLTLLMLFRQLLFKSINKYHGDDENAALLEYLMQQNATGAPGEEEMEMELLENALHLKQVRANDCMSPRNEIINIDIQASIKELRELFAESGLSRIIVTDGDIDKAVGYVHVQQLFTRPRSIRSVMMPITFVPESIQVNDLLSKFIKNRTNIACVVDEYGSISGLVTLEDALEQLFGKIDDEHDQEDFIDVKINDHEYLFSGRLDVEFLNEKYPELNIPPGDYNTLSGYIISAAQSIPEQGARLKLGDNTFLLELVSDRKIETVRVLC